MTVHGKTPASRITNKDALLQILDLLPFWYSMTVGWKSQPSVVKAYALRLGSRSLKH